MCLEAIQLSSLVEAYVAFGVQVGGCSGTPRCSLLQNIGLRFMTDDMVVKCFGLEHGSVFMRHICIALHYRSTYGKTRDLSLTVSRYSVWSLGLCIVYLIYV